MQDKTTRADDCSGGYHERIQELVIVRVLSEQPYDFTIAELVLYFGEQKHLVDQPADVEAAIQELIGNGLLHRVGDTVRPTRPIVIYERLNPL